MGKAIFRAFDVGVGDCIFLTLKDNGMQFSIMVDCGKFSDSICSYITDELRKHIDLLIITHIDDDHIAGIQSMLSEFKDLSIGQILYNCAQGCRLSPTKPLPEALSINLDELRNTTFQSNDNGEVSAYKALTVAENLLANDDWRQAWEKQEGYVTAKTNDLLLPDNFGKIVFLSPDSEVMGRLDAEFRKAFNEKLYDRYDGPYDNEVTIYEIIMSHLPEKEGINQILIASDALTINAIKRLSTINPPHSISDNNIASIAFLWECGDSRILFCGDADPETIVYNYLRRSNPFDGKALMKAIKVPHHGSEHNSGAKFWETFDSEHVFFTGADKNGKRSSKICIAKVINRATEVKRNLHFTKTSISERWASEASQPTKDSLKYITTTDCTYEFEY